MIPNRSRFRMLNPPPTQSAEPFPRWLPLALFAVTLVLIFHRLLAGEVLFWGLPSLQFYPWRAFAIAELQAGRLPLWNPFNGAGAPLLANYQSALLYPPNWISFLIPGSLSGLQVIGWVGVLHLAWAWFGMWKYTGILGLSPLARGVAAFAFALNSAVVARFGTLPMLDVAAWLPWLIYAAERLIRRQRVLDVALLSIVAAMQLLAGHAQWTFYSLILVSAYTLYRVRLNIRPLLMIAAGLALGFGLAAIQLAPTAELQRQSQRSAGVNEDFALNFSYEWPILITQLTPSFYGNPGDGSYLIGGAYFETASYIGMLPFLIAVIAIGHYLIYRRRLERSVSIRLIPFFAMVTLIAFLMAFGRNSPLFVFLFRHVPTFNLFQAPARWLLLAAFSLSVLAGVGVSLWKPTRRDLNRARLGFAGAVSFMLFALILRWLMPDRPLLNGVLTLGLQAVLVSIVFVTQPKLESPYYKRWAIGVLLFVAADLAWANSLSNPTTSADFYQPRPLTSPARTFWTDKELSQQEFDQFLSFKDYRVAGQRREEYRTAGFPNLNLLDRQPSFSTFEPLRPGGIDRFTGLLNEHPAANLYAAAVIPHDTERQPPRAWLAPTVIVSQDPLRAMSDPAWQPLQTVFVEGDAPPLAGTQAGSVSLAEETPLALAFTTDSPAQAALVVADTWYPGWIATIDGLTNGDMNASAAPIYRANMAFRAVIVPAGKHTVTMHYEPLSLRVGALISGGAVLIWILLLIGGVRLAAVARGGQHDQTEHEQQH